MIHVTEIHKNNFEKLINLLKTEHVRVGYSINENNLSHNIQKILLDLEITNVRTTYTNCDGLIEYEFSSFWTRKASLYFSKNLCEKEQSRKGYHANPSEMIEVWGLGDGWIMWIDYDFI